MAAVGATALLFACAPLPGLKPAQPQRPGAVEPSPGEPQVEITHERIDPMAAVKGDKPLPATNGSLERIDCLSGHEHLHARVALEARGGQITSFAYYSRWQFYTCSIALDHRDPKVRWRRTAEGATRVQTPQGSFVIHADPKSYVIEFQNVQRMKFCGMFGEINGAMTIRRKISPPRCAAAGILDR